MARAAAKTTQKLNGQDFWAWMHVQATADGSSEARTSPAAEDEAHHNDGWEGPTVEDPRMSATQELTVPGYYCWPADG